MAIYEETGNIAAFGISDHRHYEGKKRLSVEIIPIHEFHSWALEDKDLFALATCVLKAFSFAEIRNNDELRGIFDHYAEIKNREEE